MIFHVLDNVYEHPVVIASRPHASTQAVKRYLRTHLPNSAEALANNTVYRLGRCEGVTTCFEDRQLTVVLLKDPPHCPRTTAILVHELVHAVADVFGHKGVDFAAANDEAVAYYLEFLVRSALGHFEAARING